MLLDKLDDFIKKFIFLLESNYGHEKSYRGNLVRNLIKNYKSNSLMENYPINGSSSYVENKGKKFAVCLREQKSGNGNFHDYTLLQFIILHELSHLSSFSYGHNDEFWINFKFLLMEAKRLDIYNPINFKFIPTTYCNVLIDYNPYFDSNIPLVK